MSEANASQLRWEGQMLYMMLLYWNENKPPEEDTIPKHFQFADAARARNAYVYSEALGGSASATTVRPVDGNFSTTDGPYAETKEAMGGFYVLDCPDLDDALAQAEAIAAFSHSPVEVRPVMDVPDWDYGITSDRQRQSMG